jgi:hypothetical protein
MDEFNERISRVQQAQISLKQQIERIQSKLISISASSSCKKADSILRKCVLVGEKTALAQQKASTLMNKLS